MLFLDGFTSLNLNRATAVAFTLAIALMMYALLLFVRETRIASASLRIPHSFMEWDRKL